MDAAVTGRLGVRATEVLVRRRILKLVSAEAPARSPLDSHPVAGAPSAPHRRFPLTDSLRHDHFARATRALIFGWPGAPAG